MVGRLGVGDDVKGSISGNGTGREGGGGCMVCDEDRDNVNNRNLVGVNMNIIMNTMNEFHAIRNMHFNGHSHRHGDIMGGSLSVPTMKQIEIDELTTTVVVLSDF